MAANRNGDLKEYITSGVTRDEFLRRLAHVFPSSALRTATGQPAASSRSNPVTLYSREAQPVSPLQAGSSSTTASPNIATSIHQESRAVQDMLAERAARLELDKKKKEAAENAKRTAEAKARKAAVGEEAPVGTQKSADMKYALMQKKHHQEARAERERILKRVEDNKAERRGREAQRKAQARAKDDAKNRDGESASSSSIVPPASMNKSVQCALQIRLFDGSTIRSRFSWDGSLGADVRPWIDEHQNSDTPYTFKHVLTPLPNKNISISDEEQSLYSQGLTPSATLILVPVQGYTSAYKDGAASGILSRAASGGYSLVSSGVGLVAGVLGGFLGGRGTASPAEDRPAALSPPTPNPGINVRTLNDHDRDDQQFYNGNAVCTAQPTVGHLLTHVQLNFEPRKDEDDKKED